MGPSPAKSPSTPQTQLGANLTRERFQERRAEEGPWLHLQPCPCGSPPARETLPESCLCPAGARERSQAASSSTFHSCPLSNWSQPGAPRASGRGMARASPKSREPGNRCAGGPGQTSDDTHCRPDRRTQRGKATTPARCSKARRGGGGQPGRPHGEAGACWQGPINRSSLTRPGTGEGVQASTQVNDKWVGTQRSQRLAALAGSPASGQCWGGGTETVSGPLLANPC